MIGIDFGTTNTSASLVQPNGQEIAVHLRDTRPEEVMKTAVLFTDNGIIVGDEALRAYDRYLASPQRLVSSQRLLTAFKQILAERETGRTRWTRREDVSVRTHPLYPDMPDVEHRIEYALEAESVSSNCPEGLCLADITRAATHVFKHIGAKLTRQVGKTEVEAVVVGIPLEFSDLAKLRIINAVVNAGLVARKQVHLFPEPIAVALAYGVERRLPKRVLVFDHGGGTLDIAIVDIEGHPDGELHYRVLGQAGHPRAGRYYDRLLLTALIEASGDQGEAFLKSLQVEDPMDISHPHLLDSVERLKEGLCTPQEMRAFTRSTRQASGPATFAYVVPQSDFAFYQPTDVGMFNRALASEIATIREILERTVAHAEANGGRGRVGSGPGGVEEILLAGGSSKIPAMSTLVQDVFPDIPVNNQYAGSRTSTHGFARVTRYRKFIDDLTDTEYGIYDPGDCCVATVVTVGVPTKQTRAAALRGSPNGFYLVPEKEAASLVLLARRSERWEPVLMSEVQTKSTSGGVLQAVVEINDSDSMPRFQFFSHEPGEPIVPGSVVPTQDIPVLEIGNIVRFHDSITQPREGVGCVSSIREIGSARKSAMAIGNMRDYRIELHHPDGRLAEFTSHNKDVEVYGIELPRPGEKVTLEHLDPRRFKALPKTSLKRYVRVPFPDSYWVVPGMLLAGEYPGSPDDEIARAKISSLARCGIRHIIDLTDEQDGLTPYDAFLRGSETAHTLELTRERISIRDLGTPTPDTMRQILDAIDSRIGAKRPVYVHCWGGVGRTGTVIGCYLVHQGLKGEEALRRLAELRRSTPKGCRESPETPEQREMVLRWSEQHYSQLHHSIPLRMTGTSTQC